MGQKLKSREGKEIYNKRKQTVELVFGVMLRGKAETDAEWPLVCSAYNPLNSFLRCKYH